MRNVVSHVLRKTLGSVGALALLSGLPMAGLAAEAGDAPGSRATLERVEQGASSSTFSGLTGLIRVPNADVIPEGDLRLGVTPSPSSTESPMPGGASNDVLTMGFVRNAEIGISLGEAQFGHDLIVQAKLNLARETAGRPGVAVGVLDLRRTNLDVGPTFFAVASKHLARGRAEATLGLSGGEHSGVLAGLSLRPVPWLELQGEYDTDRFNYGAAVHVGSRFVARAAKVDVGTAYTLSYQFPLAYPEAPSRPPASAELGPPVEPGDRAATALIQEELVGMGLENVQVQIQPVDSVRTLCISFDNRQYTLNDYDAVMAVLPVAARLAGSEVEQVAMRVQKRGLVTAEVTAPLDGYRRFARDEMTGREFAAQVTVERLPGSHPSDVLTSPTEVANPPWGRVDLTLEPGLRTEIGTETDTLLTGWSLEPGVILWPVRGMQLNARWKFPVAGPLIREHKNELITDEALLSYAARPSRRFLVQALGGRFSDRTFQHWDGYGVEMATPVGSQGLLHLTAARLDNDEIGKNTYVVADYWHQVPRSNLQVRLLGGRFLYQDEGYGVDLIRFSREVQVAVGMRHTGFDNVLEVRTSFPLGPRRQPRRPSALRARLADRFDYNSRSLLSDRNYVSLAQRVGKELFIGPNLIDSFFNRDRLSSDSFVIYLQSAK